ncbi:MAG: manganese efflux pump [Clostridiales bacterium]|nr:manganese efflux pump [Clostridiales bacterium]
MDYLSLLGIAIGLSMDAFAVSVTNGAVTRGLRIAHALKIAVCFGLFQAVMPMIGWAIGKAGEGLISQLDHWIAFVLLGYIGGKMIYDAWKDRNKETECQSRNPIGFRMLIVMAIATSIDALATGIILPSAVGASTVALMGYAVSIIGVTTFAISLSGVFIGKKFGDLFCSKAELLGGFVLVFIGTKILIEHLFFS